MSAVTTIPQAPGPATPASDAPAREFRAGAQASSASGGKDSAQVDWGRVYREAVAALEPVVGRALMEEVAQEGMYLVFAGEAPERMAAETVAGHVARSGLRAAQMNQRTERWRRAPRVSNRVATALYVPVPTSEAVLSTEEARERRFARLIEAIGDDREVADIVRLVREGIWIDGEQAARLGIAIEAVRNARKRLRRHIEAVNAREDRERRQAQTGEEPPK